MTEVRELETYDAQWLLEQPLEGGSWIVEGLLPNGALAAFSGVPKGGKSIFMTNMVVAVSKSEDYLGFKTHATEALVLALEENLYRIQTRLQDATDEIPNTLRFAVTASTLHDGLISELEEYMQQYPKTGLIVIDTLAMVRGSSQPGSNIYQSDYNDLNLLRKFIACHSESGLSILFITHNRKLASDDPFEMISGSTAISGAVDVMMTLSKVNRGEGTATLCVTGRDVEYSEYKLQFQNGRWALIEKTTREEIRSRSVPGSIHQVLDFMAARTMGWAGTATALIKEAGIQDVKPNVLAKYLNEHRDFLLSRGVEYTRDRTGAARTMYLEKVPVEVPNEE